MSTHPKRPAAASKPVQARLKQFMEALSSFRRSGQRDTAHRKKEPVMEEAALAPIIPLVDGARLSRLMFVRAVLDWRDCAQVKVASEALQLQAQVSEHVRGNLRRQHFLQSVTAPTAEKALQEWLSKELVPPLQRCMRQQQSLLHQLSATAGADLEERLRIPTMPSGARPDGLAKLSFSPRREAEIISAIDTWLLAGPDSVVERFCAQTSEIAVTLMKSRPC
ncbi:hypothetical protein [Pseudacidovorax sp. NFM-22]|uniref:hypothetical protein n=1 Tax=Pseudacidovorax sp. NFM-22 TaxID=2744469 RepID=UPI001F1CA5F4|nr:hypothetical protein [Pseudacidovorax sp. NFM-22]